MSSSLIGERGVFSVKDGKNRVLFGSGGFIRVKVGNGIAKGKK